MKEVIIDNSSSSRQSKERDASLKISEEHDKCEEKSTKKGQIKFCELESKRGIMGNEPLRKTIKISKVWLQESSWKKLFNMEHSKA